MQNDKLDLPASNPGIIRVTGNQYWFGNLEHKTFPRILLGAACFLVLIMIAIWFEPRPSGEPERFIILLTIFAVVLEMALLWAYCWSRKKSTLSAMLDMEIESFAVIEFYTGRLKRMVPCNELIIYLDAVTSYGSDSIQLGRIGAIIEIREANSKQLEPDSDSDFPIVLQEFYFCEPAIKSAQILMEALPWKGIEGDVHLMTLWIEAHK